jgi:hypothetical protein
MKTDCEWQMITTVLYSKSDIRAYMNKVKLVVLPYLILLVYGYPLGKLQTFLPSWLNTLSRSARQPDVFLLLMLFARKLTILTWIKLGLLISHNFTYLVRLGVIVSIMRVSYCIVLHRVSFSLFVLKFVSYLYIFCISLLFLALLFCA